MKLTDIMGEAGLASWAELGLVVSFITFAAIVAYVFVVRSRASYEDARHLPLAEDRDGCPPRSSGDVRGSGTPDPTVVTKSNRGSADPAPPEASS